CSMCSKVGPFWPHRSGNDALQVACTVCSGRVHASEEDVQHYCTSSCVPFGRPRSLLPPSAPRRPLEVDTNTNIGGVPPPREEDSDPGDGGNILASRVAEALPPTPESGVISPLWRQPPVLVLVPTSRPPSPAPVPRAATPELRGSSQGPRRPAGGPAHRPAASSPARGSAGPELAGALTSPPLMFPALFPLGLPGLARLPPAAAAMPHGRGEVPVRVALLSGEEPYGSTGVLEALSVAVQRRRPVFVCPVVDFAAFEGLQRAAASAAGDAPAPAPAGAAGAPGARAAQPGGGRSAPAPAAPLSTMVMLRPLSTVEEAFAALRHEQMLRGDFVRAELLLDDGGGGQRGAAAPAASPTRVLKREETCCGAEAAPPRRVRSCSGSSPTRRRLLASARPSASRRAWPSPPRG
ncbi:unnamed protein product, partial [Prorocentrum cordatum]